MLAELPSWVDDRFVRGASIAVVAGAVVLAIITLVWVRSLGTRLIVLALLGVAVFAGLRFRNDIAECAKRCDCSVLGGELQVDGCSFSASS